MAALANFTLTDSETVVHTFTPLAHSANNATFRETGLSSSLAAAVATYDKLRVKGNGGIEKVRSTLFQPVLEANLAPNSEGYTAAPRIAYSLTFTCELKTPTRATVLQRTNIVALGRSLPVIPVGLDIFYSGLMPY